MSPALSALALSAVSLAALAAIAYGDLRGWSLVPREPLLMAAMASALAALQALLVHRSRSAAGGSVLIVRDGAVHSALGAAPGRTVAVLVHSGQAVVTESLGQFSRVLSPGLATLKPGESVYKIVSTQPRTLMGTVDCATREGIPVSVDFEVTAQITTARSEPAAGNGFGPSPQRPSAHPPRAGSHAWSSAAVVRAAYESHSWESAVLAETRAVLRDLVVQTYLDALCTPAAGSGGARHGLDDLQDHAHPKVTAAARRWGLSVTEVRVHNLQLPAEVTGTLLRRWNVRGPTSSPQRGTARIPCETSDAPEPSQGLALAPVLAREGFSTLRQALREPAAMVVAVSASVDGRAFHAGAIAGSPDIVHARGDRRYFAVRVQGDSLSDLALADGDYVVMEDGTEADDGDVVAVSWEGRVALWRYWKRTDHVLLAPEFGTRSPLALVSTAKVAAAIHQHYWAHHPPVEVVMQTDVRLLGRAVAALREARAGLQGESPARAAGDAFASSARTGM